MCKEHLSVRATMQKFEINDHKTIDRCERIYLTERLEGLAIKRRGRSGKNQSPKLLREVEKLFLQRFNSYVRRMNI